MLDLNSPCNASSTEYVFAVGNDWVGGCVVADSAVFLTFYVQAEGFLEEGSVFVVEGNHILIFEKGKEVFDPGLAKSPMIATIND